MKRVLFLLFISISGAATAQDTTSAKKFSHEIGVNSVLLIKQIISNNPAQTLSQLPYQVIYTMNIDQKFGGRAGLGINQVNSKTKVEGQTIPNTNDNFFLASRLGGNMNFLNHKKITANVFVDGIFEYSTLNSYSFTDFGGGSSQTNELDAKSTAFGGQAGFGVKYSFNKHIALYTEVPLQVRTTDSKETHVQTSNFGSQITTSREVSSSDRVATFIFLPTTLFLTIMF